MKIGRGFARKLVSSVGGNLGGASHGKIDVRKPTENNWSRPEAPKGDLSRPDDLPRHDELAGNRYKGKVARASCELGEGEPLVSICDRKRNLRDDLLRLYCGREETTEEVVNRNNSSTSAA